MKKEGEMENELVLPGQELGVEEEFLASRNTYLDNGIIRATVFGKVIKKDNKIEIDPIKAINKLKVNMFVLGKIIDSAGSVVFVKIDDIKIANEEYLALTDGKIIIKSKNRDERIERPCGLNDIVLARITDEEDTYILDIFEHEAGVVFSRCPICGRAMDVNNNFLECKVCEYKTEKKISPLYMNIDEINKFLNDKNVEILSSSNESAEHKYDDRRRHFNRGFNRHVDERRRGFKTHHYFRGPRNYNKV